MKEILASPEWWQAWAGVTGVAVTVLGFGLVHRQLRMARKTLEATAHNSVYDMGQAIYLKLADHPDLRPYIFERRGMPEGDQQQQRVLALCEVMCDFFEYIIIERHSMNAEMLRCWREHMLDTFTQSDAMRLYLASRRNQYTRDFMAIFDAAQARKP